ncbi:MAG: hypothetical protein C0507_20410, partial [Cyanobacteria bacterium PR.3.49]|nr:hypothetical protein [Cyanobacteria bacterium PR.3.49]
VTTHLSDASAAVSKRATDLYNSSPSLQYMGVPIRYIGLPVINGVSSIPANIGRIAEGIKSIATPSEATRTSVLSFADRGMQKAERGVVSFNNSLESAGNAYISAAQFTGNRAMAVGNSAVTYVKPHVESAITAAKPYATSALEGTKNVSSRVVNGTVETTRNLYNAERTQNAITSTRDAYDLTRATAVVIADSLKNSASVMGERISARRAALNERVAVERFTHEAERVAQDYLRLPSVGRVSAVDGTELGPIVRNAYGNHFYIENLLRGRGVVHPLRVENQQYGNARFVDVPHGLHATSPLDLAPGKIIPLNDVAISPNTRWIALHNYRLNRRESM